MNFKFSGTEKYTDIEKVLGGVKRIIELEIKNYLQNNSEMPRQTIFIRKFYFYIIKYKYCLRDNNLTLLRITRSGWNTSATGTEGDERLLQQLLRLSDIH